MSRESKIKSPFPGLRPFKTDECGIFFGRDGLSDTLLDKLHAARFVAVVGTSGSGKSSLVVAGLLPALRGGFMRGAGSRWRVALFRPGDDPIGSLARALAEAGLPADSDGPRGVERALRRSSLGLAETVRDWGLSPDENLLILVDQFEELYRFNPGAAASLPSDEAVAFVRLLLETTQQTDLPVYFIITMRSDYMGESAHFWGLPEAINRGQFLIPRMDDDERREAVEGPVKVFGARISAPLVNRLLNDAGDDPRQLPILQHALMRTWDYWLAHRKDESEPLGVEHYKAVGGMAHALSLSADEAYGELDERQQSIAEKMFKRLTEREAGARVGRLPATFGELQEIAEAGAIEVAAVIETFLKEGRSFLMPPTPGPLEAKTVIDISHESLITGWERLGEWAREEAKSAEMYRRVADAAARRECGEAGPWRDPDLKFALEWRERERPNAAWARRYDPNFDRAMSFLDESRALREQEEKHKQEEERRKQEEERAINEAKVAQAEAQQRLAEEKAAALKRDSEHAALLLVEQQKVAKEERARAEVQTRYARRLRWLVFALVLLMLVTTAFGAYAMTMSVMANRARREAEGARTVADLNAKAAAEAKLRAEIAAHAAEDATGKAEAARTLADQRSTDLNLALKRERQALAEKERQRKEAERLKLEAQTQAERAEKEKLRTIEANQKDIKNREALNAFLRGELSAAERTFKELLDSYKDNPEGQAWVHYNLGAIFRKRGNYTGAVEQYEQALKTLNRFLEQRHDEKQSKRGLMAYYHGLAQVEAELGEHDKAEKNYEEVLTIAGAEPSGDDDRVIRLDIWSYQADLYRDKVIAADSNIQALQSELSELRRRLTTTPSQNASGARPPQGPQSPASGKSTENESAIIAQVLERDKKLRELQQLRHCYFLQARAYFDNVLQDREEKLLPDSPSLAVSYGWLAEVIPPSRRTNELVELSKRIKEAGAASRAKDSDNLIKNYRALAEQYLSLGKYFHAVWAQERVVSWERERGQVSAKDLLTLARAYRGAEKRKDAKRPAFLAQGHYVSSFYEGARGNYEAVFRMREESGTGTVELNRELADFYTENKKYDEAEQSYLRLQWDKMPSSVKVELQRQLANVYIKNVKYGEAERIYLKLLGSMNPESGDAQEMSRRLVDFYRERKNYAAAEKYQSALLADARAKAATAEQEAAQTATEEQARARNRARSIALLRLSAELMQMADLRAEENKVDEAEGLYKQALEIRGRLAAPDDLLLSGMTLRLANFYANRKKDYAQAKEPYFYVAQAWRKAMGSERRYRYIDDTIVGVDLYAAVEPTDFIESLHSLALIHTSRNEFEEARLLYKEAQDYHDAVVKGGGSPGKFNTFNSVYARAAGDYAALLRKLNDPGAALEEQKAAKLKEQVDRVAAQGEEEVEDYPEADCPAETNAARTGGAIVLSTSPEARP